MNLLHCLKSFVTIANYQSFSSAARKLYVSVSKLSKEISWLEDHFKMKLFIRSTRQLSLTENGELLYWKAVKLLKDFDQLQNLAEDDSEELSGELKIHLTVTPAIPYLVDLSLKFMQEHPKMELSIFVASDLGTLGENFFDLSISFDRIKHPNYHCKLLYNIKRGIYGSPRYIEKQGPLESIEQLSDHNCLINTLYGLQNKWILGEKIIQVAGNFKSDNAGVLKQAAVADIGLIWVPPFSVKEEVENGELINLLPGEVSPEIALYYIYPTYIANIRNIENLVKFYQTQALEDGFASA